MLTDLEEIRRLDGDLIQLNPKEEAGLRYYVAAREAPIGASKSAEMFELYLRGRDTDQIRAANSAFSLGAVVYARILYRWDLGRQEVQQRLRQATIDRVVHARLEAANFSLDLLSAAQKLWAGGLQQFLQTGDPADFPVEIKPKNLRDFKAVTEIAKGFLHPVKRGAPVSDDDEDDVPATQEPGEVVVAEMEQRNPSDVLRLLAAASQQDS